MKWLNIMSIFLIGSGLACSSQTSAPDISPPVNTPHSMKLTSPAFADNNAIPSQYTCDGNNINPPLEIAAVPKDTQSLALIVDDPDAPAGTWVHWVVWNISPDAVRIEENSVPPGSVEGVTSFGAQEYGGPCPPSGTHRYFFKLYALSAPLSLPATSKKADVEAAMRLIVLDTAELVGTYQR